MNEVFFKKRLVAESEGLLVITDEYISIHETPCFHFCVLKGQERLYKVLKSGDESIMSYARRAKILKRIDKKCSRFAFDTEEKALAHLKFLKQRQLRHLKRDTDFIKCFLSEKLEESWDHHVVENSEEVVNAYCCFD